MTEDLVIRVCFVLMVVMCIGIVAAMFHDVSHREDLVSKCESKGGELLDRTYRAGKTTGHNYTCVNPSIIIDIGEE